jgi:hypothetical protein
VISAFAFDADQKRLTRLQHEIRSDPKFINGSTKTSADGTTTTTDAWGWYQRKTNQGTGLTQPRHRTPEEIERARIIAEGGSFNPDGSFAGYSRGKFPIGTDDLVEGVIGGAGALARVSLETAHTIDTLADDRASGWQKLRKIWRLSQSYWKIWIDSKNVANEGYPLGNNTRPVTPSYVKFYRDEYRKSLARLDRQREVFQREQLEFGKAEKLKNLEARSGVVNGPYYQRWIEASPKYDAEREKFEALQSTVDRYQRILEEGEEKLRRLDELRKE